MAQTDARTLQTALLALQHLALRDHRLEAESQRARREFFGVPVANVPARNLGGAEQRFFEWFLLERESLALAAVPAECLPLDGAQEGLLGSAAGVYRVVSVAPQGAEVRDLQDDEVLDVAVPPGVLVEGDLLVGRLYPGVRGRWQPSAAVALYRPGLTLADAFQRDLARLQLDRRLSQAEIEQLLLQRHQATPTRASDAVPTSEPAAPSAAPVGRPVEHVEAELEAVLAAGGVHGRATAISDALLQADRPGIVVGPLLDQLAFETGVDLERTRLLLVELWGAQHVRQAGPEVAAEPEPPVGNAGPPGETLGERLVRELDAGLARKADVGELFRQIETLAGIEPDDDDDGFLGDDADHAAEPTPVHAGDGDFGPLVAEFVWETDCAGSDAAAVLQLWVDLQQNAALPHTDVEQITGQDLMRLLLHVYLGAAPDGRAAAVRDACAAVERFSAWAEATQELSLARALADCKGPLLDQVDRLQQVGQLLTTAASAAATPTLFRVDDVGTDGFGVRGDDGSHWIRAAPATAALLHVDDLLLGAVANAHGGERLCGLVVALPGDAEALIG